MLTNTYIYTQFNDFACICWWVGGLMHQLTPSVYTSIHLSKHRPFYLHIHKVLHIGLFMGWLSYVPPTTKIHTYSVKSTHLSIYSIPSIQPIKSIHPSIHNLSIHSNPHISIYRFIHTYIYPYIYYIAGKLKNALNHVLICGRFENFSIFHGNTLNCYTLNR